MRKAAALFRFLRFGELPTPQSALPFFLGILYCSSVTAQPTDSVPMSKPAKYAIFSLPCIDKTAFCVRMDM